MVIVTVYWPLCETTSVFPCVPSPQARETVAPSYWVLYPATSLVDDPSEVAMMFRSGSTGVQTALTSVEEETAVLGS